METGITLAAKERRDVNNIRTEKRNPENTLRILESPDITLIPNKEGPPLKITC